MPVRRHRNDTATFAELGFAGGSRSITAMLNNVYNAIEHQIGRSATPLATKRKLKAQAVRFARRVLRIP
jgi:hypothetical protein